MAPVKDKNFKVIKYEDGRSPAARLKKLIFIALAAIIMITVAAYLIFSPRGGAPGVQGDFPDELVRAYGEFVRPYAAGGSLSPTQVQVGEWHQFFDRQSQQWLRDNTAKLSFVGSRQDPVTWNEWNSARREIEAMKYLLTQAPFRGGVVNNIRSDDAKQEALVELKSLDKIHTVRLIRESGGWRFSDVMGQKERLDQSMASVTLP
jgi:hypothetical protein